MCHYITNVYYKLCKLIINLVSEWSYYVCKFLKDFKKIKYWTRLEIG